MNVLKALKEYKKDYCEMWLGEEKNSEFKLLINGKLAVHCKYKDGVKHGFYKEYDLLDHNLTMTCCYYEGELEGEYKRWDMEDGHLMIHRIYSDGKIIETYVELPGSQMLYTLESD